MVQPDVHIEYERIFGAVHYPTLFDKEDLVYSELRKEIIDTPRLFISSSKLPFEHIYGFSIERQTDNHSGFIEQESCYYDVYDIIVGIKNHTINKIIGILSTLSGIETNL